MHDGFANDGGTPNTEMPEERMVLEFTETALGSKLSAISYCKSFKEMDQLIEMGQVEGMREPNGRMDDVLADLASFAAGDDTKWRHVESGESFGFVGVVVEAAPPHRLVTTERMVSPADPEGRGSAETLNEPTFTPVEGGTLASCLVTYPSAEVREMVLATAMADGKEASFKRLENEVFA